ncbi:MAG: glycosyltransferase family 4 protein [Desulfomonilaceae bacterium]
MSTIAFVHSNNDDVGGSDLAMWRVVCACNDAGYDTLVVISRHNMIWELYERHGIAVHQVPMPRLSKSRNPFFYPMWLLALCVTTVRLMRLFSRERVDLVFANDFNELPATLAGRLLGLPRIMRLRFIFRLPSWIRRGYMSLLAWSTDRVLCVSEAVRLSNFYDVRRFQDRVLTLYDWHEENINRGIHDCQANPFERFDIGQSARVVLMPARMEPWKGQHVLVEAAPDILAAVPDAVILFVGDVVRGRGREKYPEQLRTRIREESLSARVIFSGYVKDLDVLMRAASVVVSCTTDPPEPFGLTVLEALWYGSPLVVPATGGPLEIVGNPPAALLHTPGNAKELGTAVVRILRDRELAGELVRLGKERAAKFTREKLWTEFKCIIEEMLSARTARQRER